MDDWKLLYEEMCEEKQHYQELYTYEMQTTDRLMKMYKRRTIGFWIMSAISIGLTIALLYETQGNPF